MSAEFLPGNNITLLENGTAYFPALREAIEAAKHEIYIESYIYEDDATGRMITSALIRAAARGLIVRVMVDGFGAREFRHTLMPALKAAGVETLIYRQQNSFLKALIRFRRHRLRRLHRKIAVIDGRIAFVGGINIIDDISPNTPDNLEPRHDYAVRIEGPLLAHIHDSVRHLWDMVAWASVRRYRRINKKPLKNFPVPGHCGGMRAAFLIRDNLRHRGEIEDAYLAAIKSARQEIVIANAYFLPGLRFRRALIEAAQRGVKVTILLQGRVEYFLLHFASQALYGALLSSSINIHEYRRSFLHAKVAVIDGEWATVGSSNIDPFSLLLAREANVVVLDKEFAAKLRESLHRAMTEGGVELRHDDWKQKPWVSRITRWLAYSCVRVLIGIAGYTGKH